MITAICRNCASDIVQVSDDKETWWEHQGSGDIFCWSPTAEPMDD